MKKIVGRDTAVCRVYRGFTGSRSAGRIVSLYIGGERASGSFVQSQGEPCKPKTNGTDGAMEQQCM